VVPIAMAYVALAAVSLLGCPLPPPVVFGIMGQTVGQAGRRATRPLAWRPWCRVMAFELASRNNGSVHGAVAAPLHPDGGLARAPEPGGWQKPALR